MNYSPDEYNARLIRHTTAARVNALESERHFLQHLHKDLMARCRLIGDRIRAIDEQIKAEQAQAPRIQ